jgi:hypothetical protein
MKARIIDLRYRMKDVLSALDRNETVTVLYRGEVKGTIVPSGSDRRGRVKDHPLFGSASSAGGSVEEEMDALRASRTDAI